MCPVRNVTYVSGRSPKSATNSICIERIRSFANALLQSAARGFGENDKFQRLPLHEAIVLKAREMHLGGATVLRGHIGFGHSSRIHSTKILRLSEDLPVVVEIVDSQE
jgi:hypothetical protein